MVYDPEHHPKKSIIMVTLVVAVSILCSVLINELFVFFGLIFWIQYTIILSYKQFKKKEKIKYDSLVHILLHPQLRFFLFVILALYGIYYAITGYVRIAYFMLLVWLFFSVNFYYYYRHLQNKHRKGKV